MLLEKPIARNLSEGRDLANKVNAIEQTTVRALRPRLMVAETSPTLTLTLAPTPNLTLTPTLALALTLTPSPTPTPTPTLALTLTLT